MTEQKKEYQHTIAKRGILFRHWSAFRQGCTDDIEACRG